MMIRILIAKGDYYDAERYAEMTYGNLRDKKNGMDQEGEEVAKGAYNLADVILRQKGDLIKAEKLAREALRIRIKVHGNDHNYVGICCDLLANILLGQNKLGDETRGLYERALALTVIHGGPDGVNAAGVNSNFGDFYLQLAMVQLTVDSLQTHFLLAKSHFEETRRILLKMYGPTHPNTVKVKSTIAMILSMLSESN
jgi:tetratricopeptide (TPR) repeat protein